MKRLLTLIVWIPTTFAALLSSFILLTHLTQTEKKIFPLKNFVSEKYQSYQMYNSLPQVLGAFTSSITSEDAIPEMTCQYLQERNSPMYPYCVSFSEIFRSYNIDPLLGLAIAECESNLGSKMPPDCHNPFGLGIHSQGTLCFDSWEEGFEAEAKFLRKTYFSKGITEPEDIMVTYTPPALEKGGSWAKCVNHFLEKFQN